MNQLPLLLPLIILQFILAITALVHVLRHPNYRFGNKVSTSINTIYHHH